MTQLDLLDLLAVPAHRPQKWTPLPGGDVEERWTVYLGTWSHELRRTVRGLCTVCRDAYRRWMDADWPKLSRELTPIVFCTPGGNPYLPAERPGARVLRLVREQLDLIQKCCGGTQCECKPHPRRQGA